MSGEVELFIVLGAVMAAEGVVLATLLAGAVYVIRGLRVRDARRRLEAIERAGER